MKGQEKVQPRRLKGFQDYHPDVMESRYHLMDIIRHEAKTAGFKAIGTPALEYSEVLLGVGGETDKQVFRFKDNGDRDITLRFDLTVPFARYVSEHQGKINFPFKRLQIGDVWRAEKPQKGRYREFCQCDLDIVGVDSTAADIEILLSFQNILSKTGIGSFTMTVGHRGILSALITSILGDISKEKETQILINIDKLDKIGASQVKEKILSLDSSFSEHQVHEILELLTNKNSEQEQIAHIKKLLSNDNVQLDALEQLISVIDVIRSTRNDHHTGKIRFDLSIARGLGYYTGIVFETTIDALPGFGSICSGGRYNKLVERYSKTELPGIGGSIGLDRLLACLQELGLLTQRATEESSIFIATASDKAMPFGFYLLQKLRDHQIPANIALKTKKLSAQFKQANKLAYPYVITIGEEEMVTKKVSLKNMKTGEEAKGVTIDDLINKFLEKK